MKREQEKKFILCFYIIILLLVINLICHIIVISKVNGSERNDTNTNETKQSSTYDTSMFTALSPSEIITKIKSGDEFVLYIGQEKCQYCQRMITTLQQAQQAYGYTTVYLDVASSTVTNSSAYNEMAKLLNVKVTGNGETKEFGEFKVTPMMAVIKNGKMVDGMIGYNTYDNFTKFLEDSGITKK